MDAWMRHSCAHPTVTTHRALLIPAERSLRLARWLHCNGPRPGAPFIAVWAPHLPPQPLEAALTMLGAAPGFDIHQEWAGQIRVADGGTLFIEQIEALSPTLQLSLARLLERGEVRPVGATRAQSVDVAVVVSTGVDLDAAVRARRFSPRLRNLLTDATVAPSAAALRFAAPPPSGEENSGLLA